jgi:hypothetical protein
VALNSNASFLEQHNLTGGVTIVRYIEGLKNPSDSVQERIYKIMFEQSQDVRIGVFRIKPSIFRFEREIRAILYPKRDVFTPLEDPHPDKSGFSLSIDNVEQGKSSHINFIDAVYVHPTLDEGSMTFQVVKEINRLFGVSEIPIIADRMEALGDDITLPPKADRV